MTDYFEWDPARYALGIGAMDREHQAIVGHMNRLHVLHAAGAAAAEVGRELDALLTATRTHFADEEAYMARIGYPGLSSHRHIHSGLLQRMGDYHSAWKRGEALGAGFFAFLSMWLKAHICGIDAKYGAFRQAA